MRNAGLSTSLAVLLASLFVALLLALPAPADAKGLPEGSCEDLLTVVDKEYSLSPLYAPPDMVHLAEYGVPSLTWGAMLREEPAKQLSALIAAADTEGKELVVASSYRSFYDQSLAHDSYASLYGTEADRVSAKPGHSEHQLGTAVDFTNAEAGYQLNQGFGDTEAARWLQDNAAEYGFTISYPPGEEEKTGYMWEPWHYRYVGTENTHKVKEAGADVRDLLLKEGVRPGCR